MRTQVVADYTFLYMRGAHLTQSMSENVKITRAETMSQNFRHTHFNAQKCRNASRWDYVYFLPTRDTWWRHKCALNKFVKKCDRQTDRPTIPFRRCFSHQRSDDGKYENLRHRQTDGQMMLVTQDPLSRAGPITFSKMGLIMSLFGGKKKLAYKED